VIALNEQRSLAFFAGLWVPQWTSVRKVRLERERIARLVTQAKSLDRANQIRTYVETVRGRAPDTLIPQTDLDRWSAWALGEADRIDPVKNGHKHADH
jgi:hypothetical protein